MSGRIVLHVSSIFLVMDGRLGGLVSLRIEMIQSWDRNEFVWIHLNLGIIQIETIGQGKHCDTSLSKLQASAKSAAPIEQPTRFTSSQKMQQNTTNGLLATYISLTSFVKLSALRIRSSCSVSTTPSKLEATHLD